MVSIKQIKSFIVVSEELSFRKASERLCISQPPLTRLIKSLESELRVTLFKREKKKISLTYEGSIFLEKAREVLLKLEEATDSLRLFDEDTTGTLRIDFTFFGISECMQKCIETFRIKYPKVKLIISETEGSYNVKEKILSNKTDIGITYGFGLDTRISSLIIEHDHVLYAIPESNAFAMKESICLGDLKNEHFILFPRLADPIWYETFLERCYSFGFSPKIIQHVESMWKKVNLVSLGTGITFTGKNFSKYNISGVKFISPKEGQTQTLPVNFSHRKTNDNPFLDSFIKIIKNEIKSNRAIELD
ncbi:DNA-binding transcriptional regulator, LysR family [Tenacibaculum sp. MAR_2009_124]|uniref:LysR family transcriptional regulator n=1 Tax=Tenacibaculum sp. MAR_2009_124 TaxID=1250059 RepID=UPI000894FE7E|nr:LysR family transcriptional regulator [Tenacibaculum sp. MAR_2009_124]SEB41286.1 DNA-binding transcriptional regulator, LysR family [Tenacibaculum sp. MAR_2009_124]